MASNQPLPPGQRESSDFPRFGILRFAKRFPSQTERIKINIAGDVGAPIIISDALERLQRIEQESDFHCVTTWSCRALCWGGYRFRDVYETIIKPEAKPVEEATYVILKGQDGARSSLLLEDLLAEDVLLADTLNGEPLSIEHGAPLRLVAPKHYAYKSVKHLSRLEFWCNDTHFRPSAFRFMDHPRARVTLEERGIGFPGWFLRHLFRPMIRPTARYFRNAMDAHTRPSEDRDD